jgi:hypothetical protein
MKRASIIITLLVLATLLAALFGVSGSASAQGESNNLTSVPAKAHRNPKLDSVLDELVTLQEKASVSAFAERHGVQRTNDRVRVVIEAQPGGEEKVRGRAKALGAEVEATYENLVQALVPVS